MSFVGNAIGKVVGGITGATQAADGASRAADAQVAASDRATQLQREIWQQQQADAKPWLDAGKGALAQLTQGIQPGGDFNRNFTMADFQADPGYQFRMQQGQSALESSAAARGSHLSGATLKALAQYGQDMGSQEYGNAYNRFNNDMTNRYNRLSGIAGGGQTANQQLQAAGTNFGAMAGNNTIGAGNARASGYVAQGNVAGNAFNSGAGLVGNVLGFLKK